MHPIGIDPQNLFPVFSEDEHCSKVISSSYSGSNSECYLRKSKCPNFFIRRRRILFVCLYSDLNLLYGEVNCLYMDVNLYSKANPYSEMSLK